MKVLLIPHTAYHVINLAYLIQPLKELGHECLFVSIENVYEYKEGVTTKLNSLKLDFVDFSENIIEEQNPNAIIVMNDWEKNANKLVRKAKLLRIPTIGIIEGVQDFFDTHYFHLRVERIRHPYMWVEFPFLMGEYDRKFIINDNAVVTGHMRFEPLWKINPEFPEEPLVIINSNFTYGRYTSEQKMWIEQTVSACKELNINYAISVHHADKMDFTGYNVYKGSLVEAIKAGSVLISRFSTTLIESMIMGKPVVFHNPHGEIVDTFQDPMGAFDITYSKEDLVNALSKVLQYKGNYTEKHSKFLKFHIHRDKNHTAAKLTATEIVKVLDRYKKYDSINDLEDNLMELINRMDLTRLDGLLSDDKLQVRQVESDLDVCRTSHSICLLTNRPGLRRFLDKILGGIMKLIGRG